MTIRRWPAVELTYRDSDRFISAGPSPIWVNLLNVCSKLQASHSRPKKWMSMVRTTETCAPSIERCLVIAPIPRRDPLGASLLPNRAAHVYW